MNRKTHHIEQKHTWFAQKIFKTAWLVLLLVWLSASLAACQPAEEPLIPTTTPTEIPTEVFFPTASEPLSVAQPTLPPVATPVIQEGAGEQPLRITFPTPAPEPVSLWRDPLYQAPWALAPFDHFFFIRPIAADKVNWPLPDYRYGGVFFRSDIVHTGIDIPTPKGIPVIAAGAGKVVWADYGLYLGTGKPNDPYGLAITIQHDFGYHGKKLYTVYAHLDRIDVVTGQRVETGEQIGAVGTTGATTGPHLHFEVRLEDNSFYSTRNPELWLAPPQNSGVLVGKLYNTNGSILSGQAVNVRSLETRRKWTVFAYGDTIVTPDEYYNENVVLSDLPAGDFQLQIDYLENPMLTEITIYPGAVTYFTFRGEKGFTVGMPSPAPPPGWLPAE